MSRRIGYADRSVFHESDLYPWVAAPAVGVIAIHSPDQGLVVGADYYELAVDGTIKKYDKAEIEAEMLKRGELKKGATADDEVMQELSVRAMLEMSAVGAPEWRAYYLDAADNVTTISSPTDWLTIPERGLALFMRRKGNQLFGDSRKKHYRKFDDGSIYSVDLVPYVLSKGIKQGIHVGDTEFEEITALVSA